MRGTLIGVPRVRYRAKIPAPAGQCGARQRKYRYRATEATSSFCRLYLTQPQEKIQKAESERWGVRYGCVLYCRTILVPLNPKATAILPGAFPMPAQR